ncbi:hypothetical protein B0E45_31705 [Sinorhizobium sp. A49]|uniref:hypothetical protein n=1 Tax=Sinorhizobium sp. A49 TaxID=1945861 RepID=UPI000985747C|nr:hypothetical protein [Sinorhizobium sp. A49]OOG61974.1 hypothetical protein B0E45_31705 [Sinorhizobium sp. A49]
MQSIDAMLVWTPNHPHTEDDATAGKVKVVTSDTDDRAYLCSAGACDIGWDAMSDSERFKQLHELAEDMIDNDNIPREAVYAELDKIDGFRASFR